MKKEITSKFSIKNYHKILEFYIVNTICEQSSCKGKNAKKYGWQKAITLRTSILNVVKQGRKECDFVYFAHTLSDMDNGVKKLGLDEYFYNKKEEVILVFDNQPNQIESIFCHIRNSLAHGRFQIYKRNDIVLYVFEDCKKNGLLTARMILKESTLLKWIEIIQNPTPSNK